MRFVLAVCLNHAPADMLVKVAGFVQAAVVVYCEHCDAATSVVGYEEVLAVSLDDEVARAGPFGRLFVDERQLAILADRICVDSARVVAVEIVDFGYGI